MKKPWLVALVLVLLFNVSSVTAVTRLKKLSENRYLITFKKLSAFGGQGRILRKLHEKSAALCLLAGFQWFEIKQESSHGRGLFKTAAGTFEVKFYHEQENEDLYDCSALSTDEEKEKMAKAYAKVNSGRGEGKDED